MAYVNKKRMKCCPKENNTYCTAGHIFTLWIICLFLVLAKLFQFLVCSYLFLTFHIPRLLHHCFVGGMSFEIQVESGKWKPCRNFVLILKLVFFLTVFSSRILTNSKVFWITFWISESDSYLSIFFRTSLKIRHQYFNTEDH